MKIILFISLLMILGCATSEPVKKSDCVGAIDVNQRCITEQCAELSNCHVYVECEESWH